MDDKTWATIAIQLGVINPGLAEEFQRTKEELGLTKSLAQALKENGLISDGDIEAVAALEPVQLNGTPQNDYQREQQAYAKQCFGAALINEEQATECLRDLIIEGQQRTLRDLLIERHYVTAEQLEKMSKPAPQPLPAVPAKPPPPMTDMELLLSLPELNLDDPVVDAEAKPDFEPMDIELDLDSAPPSPPATAPPRPAPKPAPIAITQQKAAPAAPAPSNTGVIGTKKKMKCMKCKLTLEVITRSKAPTCPKCKIPLEDVGFSPQLKTDATYTTTRLKAVSKEEALPKPAAPAAPAAAAPKYTCKICDTKFDTTPEPGGRVHCPSCGASFTPR